MDRVATLIAAQSAPARLPGIVAALAATWRLRRPPVWLAPGAACDLFLDDATSAAEIEAVARSHIGGDAIDVAVHPAVGRRKALLVADMESTIIENEMLDELAAFVGRQAEIAAITRRAMNGELDFAAALTARVAMLQGLPGAVLDEAAAQIRPMPGARALVATMRRNGATTALVTGGFRVFAEPVAAQLGFDHVVANRLDIVNGRIAGTVSPPIVTRDTKSATLIALATAQRIPLPLTMAVGDGANDLPMLQAAGLGVAFRAKPAVAATARWRLEHADLTALLYLQGYRQEEIVR